MSQCEASWEGGKCTRRARGRYCIGHEHQQSQEFAPLVPRRAKGTAGGPMATINARLPEDVAEKVEAYGKALTGRGINAGARLLYEAFAGGALIGKKPPRAEPPPGGVKCSAAVPLKVAKKVERFGGGTALLTAWASGALVSKKGRDAA